MLALFTQVYLKLFFLLTPFFVISTFLALTPDWDERERRRLARRVTGAVLAVAFALFLFGKWIFAVFGVTLDAFRIGAGALLFLSAVALARGTAGAQKEARLDDIAVVPLAIPVTVGPATTGALLVMGAELEGLAERAVAAAALVAAVLSVGLLLSLAGAVERWLGQQGLVILSKLTGLILASIAAQLVFSGARGFLLGAG